MLVGKLHRNSQPRQAPPGVPGGLPAMEGLIHQPAPVGAVIAFDMPSGFLGGLLLE
jgi:hypothetical protein